MRWVSSELISPATLAGIGRVVRTEDLPWTGVSHDPTIRKQVILQSGDVPSLIGLHRSVFLPGQLAPEHSHVDMHEVFNIIRGRGVFAIDGEPVAVSAGTTVSLAPGQTHEVRNTGSEELELLYFGLQV